LQIRGWEIVRPRLELFGFDEEFFEKIKIIFLKIGAFGRPGKASKTASTCEIKGRHLVILNG
jgi:hypothetical protein